MQFPKAVYLALGLAVAAPVPAEAATLLNIESKDAIELLRPGDTDGLALVFELFHDVTDMSVSIPTWCLTGPCDVEIFLTRRNVFDGLSVASLIAGSDAPGGGVMTPFSGLDLVAGVYSLVVAGRGGFFGWEGDTAPTAISGPYAGVVAVGAIDALISGYPPGSSWLTFDTFVPGVTITGKVEAGHVPPIPLPAAGWLLLGAFGTLVALRRRTLRRDS